MFRASFLVLLCASAVARAEQPSPPPEWAARLEAVEKELAALKAAQAAPPPAAAAATVPWYQQITWDGFVSASWTWNFNEPKSGTNQLRAFDYDHNTFRIDAAELVLQKPVANPNDYGFRVDVTYGAVAHGAAARGLFRDPTSSASLDLDLQQAFASYIIPIGKGLRVDFGKFVTPIGAEFIEGYDGYNDNHSHSWLFTLGPYTHMGFRFSYAFSDKFSVLAMLTNGWDNVKDNNAAKSFGLQASITPNPIVAIYLAYLGGPERDNNDTDFRHLIDFGLVLRPHWRFSLTFNFDWGYDQNAVPQMALNPDPAKATDALWLGGALYARVQATKRLGFIARGEVFWDRDGNRTGTPQLLGSITVTPEFKIKDGLLVRAEFRYDHSNVSFFENSQGGQRKQQTTLAFNGLYAF